MIRKSYIAIIIGMLICVGVYKPSYASLKFEKGFNIVSPKELNELDSFLEKNTDNISIENKDELVKIRNKMENYIALSQEERDFIRQCELDVIRSKIGDARFEQYIKLIEKRESDAEFSQDERYQLYQIEKELK